MPLRVSKLRVALPLTVSPEPIYERIRAVLDVAPMTNTELAEKLDVSQPAVSRWASGDSRPSMEQALELLEVIEQRLEEIRHRVDKAREAVEIGRDAVEAQEAYHESRDEEDRERMREVADRAERVLGTRTRGG